ncbi:hypothetical protein SNEBB_002334 [Seison nebaliae]|nr:hypothetical protein SNEBB_002334 [Seison nebaliae]
MGNRFSSSDNDRNIEDYHSAMSSRNQFFHNNLGKYAETFGISSERLLDIFETEIGFYDESWQGIKRHQWTLANCLSLFSKLFPNSSQVTRRMYCERIIGLFDTPFIYDIAPYQVELLEKFQTKSQCAAFQDYLNNNLDRRMINLNEKEKRIEHILKIKRILSDNYDMDNIGKLNNSNKLSDDVMLEIYPTKGLYSLRPNLLILAKNCKSHQEGDFDENQERYRMKLEYDLFNNHFLNFITFRELLIGLILMSNHHNININDMENIQSNSIYLRNFQNKLEAAFDLWDTADKRYLTPNEFNALIYAIYKISGHADGYNIKFASQCYTKCAKVSGELWKLKQLKQFQKKDMSTNCSELPPPCENRTETASELFENRFATPNDETDQYYEEICDKKDCVTKDEFIRLILNNVFFRSILAGFGSIPDITTYGEGHLIIGMPQDPSYPTLTTPKKKSKIPHEGSDKVFKGQHPVSRINSSNTYPNLYPVEDLELEISGKLSSIMKTAMCSQLEWTSPMHHQLSDDFYKSPLKKLIKSASYRDKYKTENAYWHDLLIDTNKNQLNRECRDKVKIGDIYSNIEVKTIDVNNKKEI